MEEANRRPARFGPYHRLESPTQTAAEAAQQERVGELWGRTPRGGGWPQVKAFRGELPSNARGIEFWTDVAPDGSSSPIDVRWSRRSPGVRIEGERAKIGIVVVKNTQVPVE